MDIVLRRATESDIEIVQAFGAKLLNYERENYDPSLDKDWAFSDEAKGKYLAAIKEKYVLIAEAGGRPAGFLIGGIMPVKPGDARPIKQAYLNNIYVDESQRGAGIGERLVEEFKTYCKNEGVSRIGVSVLAANETANRFYNKVGFTPRSINLSLDLE
jgi:ribosomal protein S18 acetylase RimI-like enzyme